VVLSSTSSNSATFKVNYLIPGNAAITFNIKQGSSLTKSAICDITVIAKVVPVESIQLDVTTLTLDHPQYSVDRVELNDNSLTLDVPIYEVFNVMLSDSYLTLDQNIVDVDNIALNIGDINLQV
jgi:hypothetical protein